jgi:hypothetical protein
LRELARLAGLNAKLADLSSHDEIFKKHWGVVEGWWEGSRYEEHTLAKAQKLIEGISARNHGVIRWIKLFW